MHCVCVYIVMCNHHSALYSTYVYALWTGGLLVIRHYIQRCMEHSSFLIYMLTNRWRSTPLQKILILILQHQPHLHTPTWWITVVLHLCLYMESWCMSVQV